jgi:hypothetical protein
LTWPGIFLQSSLPWYRFKHIGLLKYLCCFVHSTNFCGFDLSCSMPLIDTPYLARR